MKKCFQPESAGLPHLKKLGANDDPNDKKRQIAEMYEQILLNVPKQNEKEEKERMQQESAGSETSARFISQNFSQNESKYNEVRPEIVDSVHQEDVQDTTEEFYQIAQNIKNTALAPRPGAAVWHVHNRTAAVHWLNAQERLHNVTPWTPAPGGGKGKWRWHPAC